MPPIGAQVCCQPVPVEQAEHQRSKARRGAPSQTGRDCGAGKVVEMEGQQVAVSENVTDNTLALHLPEHLYLCKFVYVCLYANLSPSKRHCN